MSCSATYPRALSARSVSVVTVPVGGYQTMNFWPAAMMSWTSCQAIFVSV